MLELEPEIIARLESLLGDSAHVQTAQAIADLAVGKVLAPAVYVIYERGSLADPDGYGRVIIEQRWWAVCVARFADATGAGARSAVDPLAEAVYAALHNWQPPSAREPLRIADLPAADYPRGLILLPMIFATSILRCTG